MTGKDPLGIPAEPSISDVPEDAGREFQPDGRFYRIDPSWIQLSRLGGVLGGLFLIGALSVPAVVGYVSDLPGALRFLIAPVWIGLSTLILVRAWVWPGLAYRRYLYRVDETRIQIRRGVLWREVLDIPRNRVQHTDVAQGVLERSFDISHLVVHTAGTTTAAVRLDGLRQEVAFRIRDELLSRRSDDAV